MNDILLLKPGEIFLKGLNKRYFEEKLMNNLRRRLKHVGRFEVSCRQSTFYVEPRSEDADLDAALEAARQVFGFATVTRAAACEKTPEAIAKLAISHLKADMESARSFKVETKRSDKRFPMTSIELSQYVGGLLKEAYPDVEVEMHHPDLVVHRMLKAALGGRPEKFDQEVSNLPWIADNGSAVTLLSGGIDSPVSSYLIAKRGVRLVPVHFFSFPYTSELAKQKVIDLAKLLEPYTGRMTLQIVPFTHIQEEIRRQVPEEYFTLVMRRFMMRIAADIAAHSDCKAIVTGRPRDRHIRDLHPPV